MEPIIVTSDIFRSLVEDVDNRMCLLTDLWKMALGLRIRDLKERCPSVYACPSLYALPREIAERLEDMLSTTTSRFFFDLGAKELDAVIGRRVNIALAPLLSQESEAGSQQHSRMTPPAASTPRSLSTSPPPHALTATPQVDTAVVAKVTRGRTTPHTPTCL